MLNRSSFLVTLALALLVAITSWYAASLTRIGQIPGGGLINMGIISNASMIQTTTTGALQYQGSVQSANEYNNGDIDFEGLNLKYYGTDSSPVPWLLSSNQGSVLERGEEINLIGNVTASRTQAGTAPPMLIQTESAVIYSDTKQIKGPGLITFSQPGSINKTTAVGFVADLQAKWLKLLSLVRSTYAPR